MGFPKGGNYSKVLEMPGTPQKRKWIANYQISPDIGKNCQKTNETHHFPPIPIMANGSFLEGNERNMEEIGGACAKLGKFAGESQVECYFVGFPRGKIILVVLEIIGIP